MTKIVWKEAKPRPFVGEIDETGATFFGHDRFWAAFPTLATTYFGYDLLCTRPTLATDIKNILAGTTRNPERRERCCL